ncbi:Na+/H+ antiporter [Nonomuraea jabiensis]|uniref:Na+/H+ antiporter n=1 Tax=Nonomuraea jabiensis TaxID=882448 RepID=UPI003D713BB7
MVALTLALVVGATVVSALARRLGVPSPIALVIAGIVVGLVPGLPGYQLDPELVLFGFLPPLLYAEALDTSLRDLRTNLRSITLLSVGLVLASTIAVGYLAHALVPGLPLAAGFVLGAIVAPPDALAAAAIANRVGLPRRVVTVLEGESLLNDATALVAYRIAIAAVATGLFSYGAAVLQFLLVSVIGVGFGLAVGFLVVHVRRRIEDPLTENTVSLVTPFAAYLGAETLHGSGVLAVVVTGLVVARAAPLIVSSTTRLQGQAVWEMIAYLLQGVVFALIGLQLRQILAGLHGHSAVELALYAGAVTLTLIVVRIVWVFPTVYLPRLLFPRIRARDPYPPWQAAAILSWAGLRGVVSLAAAFAIPLTAGGAPFPGRDLILFLTFAVIVATLVLQGLTLPWVSRRLRIAGMDDDLPALEQASAEHTTARLALMRLDQIVAKGALPGDVELRLRRDLEERARKAHAMLGPGADDEHLPELVEGAVTAAATYAEARRELLRVEREEAVRLWQRGEIGAEALQALQRRLDLEEQQIL